MGRKNKKLHIIFLLVLLSLFYSYSSIADEKFLINSRYSYRTIKYRPFDVGEKYKYNVRWSFINVGYGVLEVKELIDVKGREIYHVVFTARTYPFFDVFFKIRDVTESYIDKKGVFTWRLTEDVNEGKRHMWKEIVFDQQKNHSIYKDSRNREKKIEILPYTQDFISVVYYLRTFDIEKEKELLFNISNDGKTYEASVKFICKEKIRTKAGKFNAIKTDISWWKKGRKRKMKESHMFWLSADERKIPLQVESKGEIGKFITSLIKIYK